MQVNPEVWHALARAVGRAEGNVLDREALERWVSVLLTSAPPVASNFCYQNLADRCRERGALDSLVDLFDAVTTVSLRIRRGYDGLYDDQKRAPETIVDVELEGANEDDYRHTAARIWQKGLRPDIHRIARRVLTLAVSKLEAWHRTLATWRAAGLEWDPISSDCTAIAAHQNDAGHPTVNNVLIDAGRDCLEWLGENDAAAANHHCGQLAKSEAPLLRRLAIHGITERRNLEPDRKIDWILKSADLHEVAARRELRRSVYWVYRDAGTERRSAVVQAILKYRWPHHEDRQHRTLSHHFSWLELLLMAAPDCAIAQHALDQLRRRHPEFRLRSFFGLEDLPPIRNRAPNFPAIPDLLAQPAREWVDRLKLSPPADTLNRERLALAQAVESAVSQDFDWGLEFARELGQKEEWDSDLWDAVLAGWTASKLDDRQFLSILPTQNKR